nr:hypothetical protein [Tanacetum cinerariifolium]
GQRIRGNKPPTNMEPQNPTDTNLSGTGAKYKEDQTQCFRLRESKGMGTDDQAKNQRKLVKASSIVDPDPNEPDKEDEIKKSKEEARLDAISKTEVIKIVREEANKLGINPKEAITTKPGELFRKLRMLNMSKLKPKPIADIKIYPKKPVVITVYRGTDGRNFNVHKPFLFGAFGRSKLDELREIIPKKKNIVVNDMMNSLSQMYERLRKILGELRVQPALPTPGKALFQTSRRKQKHMELDPKTRILGLECNRTLLENVLFVNNMVIKEPDYGIFITGEFGDQAFQRWNDIDKVGMEAHVSYLVAASMIKSVNC